MANGIKYAIKLQLTTTPQHTWFSWESFISTFLHLLTPFVLVRWLAGMLEPPLTRLHLCLHSCSISHARQFTHTHAHTHTHTHCTCTCICDFLGFINIFLFHWICAQQFFSSVVLWYLKLNTAAAAAAASSIVEIHISQVNQTMRVFRAKSTIHATIVHSQTSICILQCNAIESNFNVLKHTERIEMVKSFSNEKFK